MGRKQRPRDASTDPRQGDPVKVGGVGLAVVSKPPRGHEDDIEKGVVWVVPVTGKRIGVPALVDDLTHPGDADQRAAWRDEISAARTRRRELRAEAEAVGVAFEYKPMPQYGVEQAGKCTYASTRLALARKVHEYEGGLLVVSADGGRSWQPV